MFPIRHRRALLPFALTFAAQLTFLPIDLPAQPLVPLGGRCDSGSAHRTIAHEVLSIENAAAPVAPCAWRTVDAMIDSARSRIRFDSIAWTRLPEGERIVEAKHALAAIDKLLGDFRIVHPGAGQPLVVWLHDALTPRTVKTAGAFVALDTHRFNAHRRSAIAANEDSTFRVTDCDLASLLFLAIGESIGLPLRMVLIGKHSFVQCPVSNESVVNWETEHGEAWSLDRYRSEYILNEALIRTGAALRAMSRDEVIAHALWIRGTERIARGESRSGLEDLRRALQKSPRNPLVVNSLAWALATDTTPGVRDVSTALRLTDTLIALYGREEEWNETRSVNRLQLARHLDTRAAALALARRFDEAAEIENRATALLENCTGLTKGQERDRAKLVCATRKLAAHYERHETYDSFTDDCDGVVRVAESK